MANGLYTESYVKRGATAGGRALQVLFIAAGILLVLYGMFSFQTLFSFVGAIVLVAYYFLSPSFNIDWEYIFCDGQIDFDRISGGEKRKTILKIDMDDIDIMAPIKSHELDSYNHRSPITVKDFSSHKPGAECYVIFMNKSGQNMKIIFEPSEKMVEFAKQKSPRKVFLD